MNAAIMARYAQLARLTRVLRLLRATTALRRGGPTLRFLVDALERLAALRERGALTDEEFAAAKRRVLG